MRINQNIAAFNAYRNLNNTQTRLQGSLEKLSSGFRINRAADDASGLVNSENLRSQIGGLKVATRNAQDAISLVQTAEGAQTEVHSILQRMRDLAVQAGNTGTNDDVSLAANQAEIEELQAELNRIGSDTQFGTLKVFQDFQVSDAVGAITAGDVTLTTDATAGAAAVATTQPATATSYNGLGPLTVTASGTATITIDGGGLTTPVEVTGLGGGTTEVTVAAMVTDIDAALPTGYAAAASAGGTTLSITGPEGETAELTVTAVQVDGSGGNGDLSPTGSATAGTPLVLSGAATATSVELTVPEGGVAVPAGYDGDVTFSLSGGGLGAAIEVVVAADATAEQIAAEFNGETGISASVNVGGNVVITGADGETATFTLEATHAGQAAREAATGAVFQIGANEGQTEALEISGVSAAALEVDTIDVTVDAGAAISDIDDAIEIVSNNRADLGAFQNRMESLTRNLSVAVENLSAAESRIRDTDMALEMVEFTRNQILSQAGTAMLAQANVIPQSVLSLLG